MSVQKADFILSLEQLLVALGISASEWKNLEFLEKIEFIDNQFNRNQLVNLNQPLLKDLLGTFQDALEFQVKLGENPVFILKSNVTQQQLIDLQRDTAESPSVKLNFRINKTRLAELYFGDFINLQKGIKQYYLYLYNDRLISYLQNSELEDLEKNIWKNNKEAFILILTPNNDNFVVGPRATILGGQYITVENCSVFQQGFEKEILLATQAYKICRENLKWQDSWLEFLTPWHLYFMDKANCSPDIMKVWQAHFGNAFLLYSADFSFSPSTGGNNKRVSRYSAPDKTVEVIHHTKMSVLEIFPQQGELLKILDWIYDLQWIASDRLTLAQHNIVDQLNLAEENNRFITLFQVAKTIRENIEWHWETFTQKNISTYMGLVKNLEDYLSEVTDGFTTNIAAVQKNLTDTMLAAVGIWVGSFIASLFDKPFNPFIFQVGLIAYGLYVLFFPLLYNMIQQWKGFNGYQDQISVRKNRFLESLPKTKVEKIWLEWKIEETKQRFTANFWWTVVIYVIVIIASFITAAILPGWVIYKTSQLITPTPIH